jgi:outer membrane biosynthesis protein TonB
VEDRTSQGTTHDLLLALAGRVDDDLLSWARELVAVGEDARAVEMLTASLVAARAVLPGPLHRALVAAARVARTDIGPAEALPAPRDEDGTEHRFAVPGADDPVAAALRGLPARTLTGCRVLLTRRVTPAGTAPGPLPHPVVLVQLPAAARPADVLAYQLAAALERAGVRASVEVLVASGTLSDYHAAALDHAVTLRTDATGTDARGAEPAQSAPADPQDDAEATAVLPATPPTPPVQPTPAQERHSLAPQPDRAAGEGDAPTPWHRDPAPAAQHPHEQHPHEQHPHEQHLREEAPREQDLREEPPADRRPPAPSPRPSAEDVASTHRLDLFGPAEQRNGRDPGGGPSGDDRSAPGRGPLAPWLGAQWNGHRSGGTTDEDDLVPARGFDDDTADDDHRDDRHLRGVDDIHDDIRDDHRDDVLDGGLHPDDERADDGVEDDHADDIRDDRRDEEHLPGPEDESPAAPHPLAPPRPVPVRDEARPAPRPAPTTRPRPTVTPISRAPVPPPTPLVRRAATHPAPRPLPVDDRPAVHDLDDDRDQGASRTDATARNRARRAPQEPDARRETPAFESLSDPLNGPLHQPLLAPLLDPTAHDDLLGPEGRRTAPEPEPEPEPADDWSQEWLSGTWAMAPSALDERSDRGVQQPGGTDEDREPPVRPAPRPVPRHRFAGDQDAAGYPLDDEDAPSRTDADDRDEPDVRHVDDEHADEHDDAHDGDGADDGDEPDDGTGTGPGGDRPGLGLRPESLARLSDADRQLLARLQAELVEGRKPRIGRRPDLARGAAPRTNGSRRSTPPDLAG